MYHKGLDDVLPEKPLKDPKTKKASVPRSLKPQKGKSIEMYVGDPIDFSEKIQAFREKNPGALDNWQSTAEAIELYVEITNEIYKAVLLLENQAWPKTEVTA
jgi:hypothetical protein